MRGWRRFFEWIVEWIAVDCGVGFVLSDFIFSMHVLNDEKRR